MRNSHLESNIGMDIQLPVCSVDSKSSHLPGPLNSSSLGSFMFLTIIVFTNWVIPFRDLIYSHNSKEKKNDDSKTYNHIFKKPLAPDHYYLFPINCCLKSERTTWRQLNIVVKSIGGRGRGEGGPLGFSSKNPSAKQETWVWSLGWKDPLGKERATHFSIIAWEIPWTVGAWQLPSRGHERVRYDLMTKQH